MNNLAMKRVVAETDGLVIKEVERPKPLPNEVLAQSIAAGVCGSDTHAVANQHPFIDLPYLPGHEVIATVREVGPEVTRVKVGDRIVVEPTLPCGQCKTCNNGNSNVCENLQFFGCGYEQGGMAEFFTIPEGRVHVVPESFSTEEASLIEPLATPAHAVRLSGGVEGKSVAIIGAGTIGLLSLLAVKAAGAKKVVVTDLLESKRERALRLGADAVVDAGSSDVVSAIRDELGESADVVFDCVANQATVDQSIQLAIKAGTVMIVGVPAGPVNVPLPQIQDYQVRIQGSATYMPEDYARAIELIESGAVPADELVTSIFPLEQVQEAFAASVSGEEVKVLVSFDA